MLWKLTTAKTLVHLGCGWRPISCLQQTSERLQLHGGGGRLAILPFKEAREGLFLFLRQQKPRAQCRNRWKSLDGGARRVCIQARCCGK